MEASFNTHTHTHVYTRPHTHTLTQCLNYLTELLSPGAESDVIMVEGCLDDQDVDRGSSPLDDMDEALISDGALLLEAGPSDLCDLHDPDLEESNRAIRYTSHTETQMCADTQVTGCALSCPLQPVHQ